ncbi:DUF4240 domain-containing protein [Nonomuraea sp. NPDC048882]|uniref:DUF4240 domain-containing protein n=1 Tax=Nonomuraea sp. NPDC048882 TaxID=3154347 RepID=UPI000AC6E7EF
MTEETFWDLIDELDGVIDDDSVDVLGEQLSSLSPEDVESFCAHLAAKVSALTELPLAGSAIPDITDAGHPPLPLSGDAHENLLYAIVAAGQARYDTVITDPSTVEESEWDAGEAELLIDLAATTLWESAGLDWYDELDPLRAPSPPDEGWWETFRGSAGKSIPAAYLTAAHELDRKLNHSAEWLAWWRQTSLRKIKVGITVNADKNHHRIERGRNIARAQFTMDRSHLTDRTPDTLRNLVSEETTHLTTAIATELRMTPPPTLQ